MIGFVRNAALVKMSSTRLKIKCRRAKTSRCAGVRQFKE